MGYNPAAQDDATEMSVAAEKVSMEGLDPWMHSLLCISDLREGSLHPRKAIEMAAVIAILVVVTSGAVWLIGQAIPLGWDESVYASKSRSLLTDSPSSTWAIYRAPGLPVVGLLGGAFGFVDANLRGVAVLLSLGALTLAWALARMLWGPSPRSSRCSPSSGRRS